MATVHYVTISPKQPVPTKQKMGYLKLVKLYTLQLAAVGHNLNNNTNEPAGYVYNPSRFFIFKVFLNVIIGQGRFFNRIFIGIRIDGYIGADFAINLHNNRNGFSLKISFIPLRPVIYVDSVRLAKI